MNPNPVIVFSRIDLPGGIPGRRWQAQLFDSDAAMFGPTPYPQAIAWLTDFTGSSLDFVMLDFILVPDPFRRKGYATALIEACEAKWPNLDLGEAISEAGEGLLESLEAKT